MLVIFHNLLIGCLFMLFCHKNISYFTEDFVFAGGEIFEFPVMLSACGHSQANERYLCDGLHPGIKKPFAVWQYTLNGEGVLEFEGRPPVPLRPGDLMLVTAPGEYRYFRSRAVREWDFIFVRIEGELGMDICANIIKAYGPVNIFSGESPAVVAAKEVIANGCDHNISSQWMASMLVYELLMRTGEELSASSSRKRIPVYIRRVLDYCTANIDRPISIAELAEVAGYSQYHFVRLFKKSVGIPPSEYVVQLRMQRARRLLQNNTVSVKEVADACGFVSASHFSRKFRDKFGISPGSLLMKY